MVEFEHDDVRLTAIDARMLAEIVDDLSADLSASLGALAKQPCFSRSWFFR